MLKEERHHLILQQVNQQKKVLTTGLSGLLAVSEDTIRRDLKELHDEGQLKKVHGGAMALSPNPTNYRDRAVYAHEEKIVLAKKAISLIRPNQVVLMDGGSTNVELTRHLPKDLSATILTNSLPIAEILSDHPTIEVIFLGGKLLKSAQVTVGEPIMRELRSIRTDLCIIGTRSLHPQLGISEIDWEETQVKRAMIDASQELASLVIQEKLGTTQPYLLAPPDRLTTLVTALDKRHPALSPYRSQGIELL